MADLTHLNKNGEAIASDYNNGIITIVPKNNGYYFSAYGKFFNEEYAPDIIEHFVTENTSKITWWKAMIDFICLSLFFYIIIFFYQI